MLALFPSSLMPIAAPEIHSPDIADTSPVLTLQDELEAAESFPADPNHPEVAEQTITACVQRLNILLAGDRNPYASDGYMPSGSPSRDAVGTYFAQISNCLSNVRDPQTRKAIKNEKDRLQAADQSKRRFLLEDPAAQSTSQKDA